LKNFFASSASIPGRSAVAAAMPFALHNPAHFHENSR
jgi:hypothetical protein